MKVGKNKIRAGCWRLFLCLLTMTISLCGHAHSQEFSTQAEYAILIDVDSGSTLFEKNADEPMSPASMGKILTLAVVFNALENGELSLDDKFPMSVNAWRKGGAASGGSTMFIDPKTETVSLKNLIRGVAIQSGNDASIVIAEGMSGSEENFAKRMNAFATKIGMTNSHFTNSTGLHDDEQFTTARDLANLGRHVIQSYPELYKIFSEPEFTWNDIRQSNRNPLLSAGAGDGIKTGFTEQSGYGLVGTRKQKGLRLLLVVNGLKTMRERAEQARRMLNWGFRAFQAQQIFDQNEVIGRARVFGGARNAVNVISKQPISVVVPRGKKGQLTAKVHYRGPLRAPIDDGQVVGDLIIRHDGKVISTIQVYTDEAVESGTLYQRALSGLFELLVGWI